MKKSFLIFLLLNSLIINAQVILKKGLFEANAIGYCRGTSFTTIANVEVDGANSELRVYTYGRIPGSFDIKITAKDGAEAPKSMKGKLGAWAKKVEATNNTYDATNAGEPAAMCIFVRKLPFEHIMTKMQDLLPNDDGIKAFYKEPYSGYPIAQTEVSLAFPNSFKPNTTYRFNKLKCEQGGVDFSTLPLMSYDQLISKYPAVDYGKEIIKSREMSSEGDGLLGLKNVRSFPVSTEYHRYVDSNSAQIKYSNIKESPLKKEEGIAALKGFYRDNNNFSISNESNSKNYVLLRSESSKEDKFSNYKIFKMVAYDNEGTITNISDIKMDYVKDPRYFNFVLDKKGKKVGILLVLSGQIIIGAKSHKDPVENNHHLYYFDLDGKEKFHYSFTHGDEDNPRGVYPVIAIEDNGIIKVWSKNYEKLLKPYSEIINFDSKSKVTYVKFPKDNGNTLYNNGLMSKYHKFQVLEDGNFLLFDQEVSKKSRQNGAFTEEYNTFSSAGFVILTPDLEVVTSAGFGSENATVPAKIDYIGKVDDSYKIIITNQYRNYFISKGKEERLIVCPDSENFAKVKLPSNPVQNNYYVDKETRKIYGIYEHTNWPMLSYLLLMSY